MAYDKIVQLYIDRSRGTFEERKAYTREHLISRISNPDIAKLDEALANAREPPKRK